MNRRDIVHTRIQYLVKTVILKNRCPKCFKLYDNHSDIQLWFGDFIEKFAFSNHQAENPFFMRFSYNPTERNILYCAKNKLLINSVLITISCFNCSKTREILMPI